MVNVIVDVVTKGCSVSYTKKRGRGDDGTERNTFLGDRGLPATGYEFVCRVGMAAREQENTTGNFQVISSPEQNNLLRTRDVGLPTSFSYTRRDQESLTVARYNRR